MAIAAAACDPAESITPDAASAFTVVGITPADGAAQVALDSPIVIELSLPPAADFDVELTTLTGDAVAHATRIAGTTVTVVPDAPLWLATGHRLTARGQRSRDGLPLAPAFAATFATRDGTWTSRSIYSEATPPAAASLGAGASPALGVAPDGTVLAMWKSSQKLVHQRYTPGAGWAATSGTLPVIGDPDGVSIATVTWDRAAAAYAEYIGTTADIRATRGSSGGWTAPVTVSPYRIGGTRYDQFLGGIAGDDTTFALVFHRGQWADHRFNLYAAIDTGAGWSQPILVSELPGMASQSRIVSDGDGGYVIAWVQDSMDRSASEVWVAAMTAAGVVSTPVMLDGGHGATYSLDLAAARGRAQIAWGHIQPDDVGLRIVTRSFAGGVATPAQVVQLPGFSFGGEWIRVALTSTATLLTWTQYGALYARNERGGTWGSTKTIAPRPVELRDDIGRPVLTLDARGNATVIWTDLPYQGRRITRFARNSAAGWSAPAMLDQDTRSSYVWTAGVDPTGRVSTLWVASDGNGYSVVAGRLE